MMRSLDLETKDPELKTMGSGSVTGTGNRTNCISCRRLVFILSNIMKVVNMDYLKYGLL